MTTLRQTSLNGSGGGLSQDRGPILFCTVCDDRFLIGAVVMLQSLMDRIPGFDRQRLKVFFDNQISPLSDRSQAQLREVAPHVEFESIANEVYRRADVREESHRAAYLTLEAFQYTGFRRVVFFDSDMLCLRDFSELFDDAAEFIACTAGAYRSEDRIVRWTKPSAPSPSLLPRAIRKLGRLTGIAFPPAEEVVINSGFMVIGKRHLGPSTYLEMIETVRRREDKAHMLDQIIINGHFQRKKIPIRLLPHSYNFRTWGGGHGSDELFEELRDEIRILHYSGYSSRPKPWDPAASDQLAAVRIWREYARDRFGSDFLTASTTVSGA
jgi:lipopolysaccharide biosynthesis glycosyltransferase